MVGFAATCAGLTYGLAELAMSVTNPEVQNEEARKVHYKKPSLHQQVSQRT